MERNMAKEQPQGLAIRRNLERLQLELSTINLGIQSYIPGQGINGNWGVPRYGVGEEVHDQTEADGAVFDKGDFFLILGFFFLKVLSFYFNTQWHKKKSNEEMLLP